MSDGIFDPKVSLDMVGDINISDKINISDIINLEENKEYWLVGLLVLIIIGYYSYELFKQTKKNKDK